MSLFQVKVEVDPAAADAIDEALQEAGITGWMVLEDALPRRAWVNGIFATPDEAAAAWPALARVLERPEEPLPEVRELADADWRNSYKAHFHRWQFGPLHWVPVWERETFAPGPGEQVLWLDPGLAFGTGNHETTRLCCERLVAWAQGGKGDAMRRVIDAGCGSGILALSAAVLGRRPVEAFDIDPEAVRVAQENAAANGLTGAVEFFVAGLEEGLANSSADLVLANIQADVLMANAAVLVAAVADDGLLVLSGILAAELAAVREVFARTAVGWTIETRTLGEWSDLALRP